MRVTEHPRYFLLLAVDVIIHSRTLGDDNIPEEQIFPSYVLYSMAMVNFTVLSVWV